MHRIALAVLRGPSARSERLRDPTGERAVRGYVFDEKFSPVWDETLLDSARTTSRGPEWWRLALEIHARRDDYDAIVTWGERLSLALTIVQRFARSRKPHIAMMCQFAKPNIQIPLRLFGGSLHAVITWNSVQRRYLIERLGFPSERVYLMRHCVDQLFYSPRAAEEDTICSVGAEMRDYPTLIEAIRGTDLRCHIAADHVRIPHRIRLVADRRVPVDTLSVPADAKITIGRKTLLELRDLYARSRFVVVPLLPSESDNGVTVILEAMAMGKPVICSRTRGSSRRHPGRGDWRLRARRGSRGAARGDAVAVERTAEGARHGRARSGLRRAASHAGTVCLERSRRRRGVARGQTGSKLMVE